MCKIPKMGAKRSLLGLFLALEQPRYLHDELTSSPGWASYFRMKLSTRLGELPSSQMLCFAINRRGKAKVKGPWVPWSLEVQKEEERREKKEKEEKTRSKRFWIASVIDSYTVHRLFFGLHSVSACFKDLNLIYGPLGVPFIVYASSSPSSIISDLFLCLKRVSTDRSYRNLI